MQNTWLENRLKKYVDEKTAGGGLPEVTAADNGMVLGVDDGEWKAVEPDSPYDAVIRLVHANNSGADIPDNLTVSIVSGTFADLNAKIQNGGYPCILVEYKHLMFGYAWSNPMGYITYVSPGGLTILVAGPSAAGGGNYTQYGSAFWLADDTISW